MIISNLKYGRTSKTSHDLNFMDVLTPDFFSDEIVWNAEAGKPERVLVEPELADDGQQNDGATAEKMTAVRPLPANYRAASPVLFGPAGGNHSQSIRSGNGSGKR